MRTLQAWLFGLFIGFVIAAPFVRGTFITKGQIGGFVAFYCAGHAVLEHRNPYRVEPLRSCERSSGYAFGAGLPEPAPLPPFALLAFAGLALLPLPAAIGVFSGLLVAATALAVWALHGLTRFNLYFLAAGLLVSDLYHNLIFGEVPPLVIGALCVAALCVERKAFVAAAVAAAAALVEPHAAAPALVAMFVLFSRTRPALLAIGTLLAGLSFATFGIAETLEYFTQVLPAHALSEVWASDQYSFTWVLHQLGFSDSAAVRAGMASYGLMSGLGIVVAMRLAARYKRPSFIVLVPPAFAMIGGGFIHDLQIPIALPAAILVLSVAAPEWRLLALVAVTGLVAPWSTLIVIGLPAVAILIWSSDIARSLDARRRAALTAAICSGYIVSLALLLALPDQLHGHYAPNVPLAAAPAENASSAWGHFVRASAYGDASIRTIARKFPLWFALLLFAYGAARAAFANNKSAERALNLPVDRLATPARR